MTADCEEALLEMEEERERELALSEGGMSERRVCSGVHKEGPKAGWRC